MGRSHTRCRRAMPRELHLATHSPLEHEVLGELVELEVERVEALDARHLRGRQRRQRCARHRRVVLRERHREPEVERLFKHILRYLRQK